MLSRAASEPRRDLLLILLGLTTGATDVIAFERLGHVFASVITGNLILLGASAVSSDGSMALHAGIALAAYATGVLVSGPRRAEQGGDATLWPRAATRALGLEFVLLAAFALCWELVDQRPSQGMQAVLLAILAAGMGVQSTAVRRLGQMSTTYLTSTLTGVVEALGAWRWSPEHKRSIGIILAAVAGAAAGLELLLHVGPWLPAVQLAPLAIVLLAAPDRGAPPGAKAPTAARSPSGR